jgi:hypothetical protein
VPYLMLDELWGFWQFNFWRGLASLAAGLVAVSPCLLVPTWRRKILHADIDIEDAGAIVLFVVLVAIGCYNYFGATNGA